MRLIDADALLERIENPYQYREVAAWVNDMPTIAQQEIIRCKDCVYYDPSDNDEESDWCHAWCDTTEGNAFCSYAKRKEKKTMEINLEQYNKMAERLTELEYKEAERQWIPCSERLPEDYADVLAWFEYFRYGDYNCLYQTYGIGDYSAEYDSWMINHETGWHKLRVLAWMPLPEPWKGEQP